MKADQKQQAGQSREETNGSTLAQQEKSHPSRLNLPQEDDPSKVVTVYIHVPSKKSVKVQLPSQIAISVLKKVISDQLGLRIGGQVLYLSGKNISQYINVRLHSQAIIHVLSSDQLCGRNQEIDIKLSFLNFYSGEGKPMKHYRVTAGQLVGVFLDKVEREIKTELKIDNPDVKFHLLESSRLLITGQNFLSQDVPKNSEITCIISLNQLRTRFYNDTNEDILKDISDLLGLEKSRQQKNNPLANPKPQNSRYLPPIKQVPIPRREDDSDPYGLKVNHSSYTPTPNFKKKGTPLIKSFSFDDSPDKERPLTKIKSSKSKRDLQHLLNSQQKQKVVFEPSQDVIKENQIDQKEEEQPKQKCKPVVSHQIPKVMPINERRKIRLQIEKLFDMGGQQQQKTKEDVNLPDLKQEKKPISPATEAVKGVDRMRLSMGSRPAFLEQLRLPVSRQSNTSD